MAAAIMAIRERNRRKHEREREEEEARAPTEAERTQQMMAALDQDGDGNVTQEEIAAYMMKQQEDAAVAAKAAAEAAARAAGESDRGMYVKLPYRKKVQRLYEDWRCQQFVAFLILFNFIAIVVEKAIDPYPVEFQRYQVAWQTIDDVCTVFFIVELVINIYGSFILPFFQSAWNWLDLVVVVVGTISLARVDLGSFARIKVLRAFRVLRLFKRIKSLNKILVALVKAIPGVINAFMVMLIFMTIYAVLAVDLFRDFGDDASYSTVQMYGQADGKYGESCGDDAIECIDGSKLGGRFTNTSVVTSMTARGFYHGQEYYGDFFRALFTLFQVLTGESWSEAIVRPLLFGWSPANAVTVAVFFTSYILLTQVVLQNVVVAVLLDKFVEDQDEKEKSPITESDATERSDDATGFPSPQALPLGTPGSGRRRMPSGEEFLELRNTMEHLMKEQQAMKGMMEQLLQRLPPPPGGLAKFEA
mmetsp:Transcript_58287/g.115687  ORF Transcript_58287/g.115687 Transcript_58287/m.115687 type:complete len:475 (-) Transcript_58287:418-1842(-)|eukprot:CAMPEP_0174734916 /NCGR_PEP_ID=MMETSP1094-20130205/64097_1 /TAXON_ID=156173 /ORGANISM="Chrysochromulina brevifilum, Strain UTEX LB 985" /LENGTH=474 /DNA_ID=CAMNT_0015937813 /DNA_START=22 /DNA_END=1446 /DNA_ORIENTATION=+